MSTMISIGPNTLIDEIVLLNSVQEQVPAADLDYLYAGAVGVGLNFLLDDRLAYTAADFDAVEAEDSQITVTLLDGDAARVTSFAAAIGVEEKLVYSAALCVGLARLAGDTTRMICFSDSL